MVYTSQLSYFCGFRTRIRIIPMFNTIKNLEWRYAVKKFDTDRMLPEEKVERD